MKVFNQATTTIAQFAGGVQYELKAGETIDLPNDVAMKLIVKNSNLIRAAENVAIEPEPMIIEPKKPKEKKGRAKK